MLSPDHPEQVFYVNGTTREDVFKQIAAFHDRVQQDGSFSPPPSPSDASSLTVVVSGYALTLCMSEEASPSTLPPQQFFADAVQCKSAICYRITPKQKVLAVRRRHF